jgi:hypothetical protein
VDDDEGVGEDCDALSFGPLIISISYSSLKMISGYRRSRQQHNMSRDNFYNSSDLGTYQSHTRAQGRAVELAELVVEGILWTGHETKSKRSLGQQRAQGDSYHEPVIN